MQGKEVISGSTREFDENWSQRTESAYSHWIKGRPQNQVQLAFRSHWQVFREMLGPMAQTRGRALEVGCGRGSLSGYFVDDGWEVTLLDHSNNVLQTARSIFASNGHEARFVTGDANGLPFPDNSFDVAYSVGLLEHFEQVRPPIAEQLRVLRPRGWFFGYIVPERPDNIQRYFNWTNRMLKLFSFLAPRGKKSVQAKSEIFRSDSNSEHYIREMRGLDYEQLTVFGMYSVPMISHSPEFPFSLLPAPIEWGLTRIFEAVLGLRRIITGRHGWICSEPMGQAFLVAFRKPEEK